MNPVDPREFKELQQLVKAMYEVQDAAFIGNLSRRVASSVRTEPPQSVGSISQAVNEGGSQTYSVAKVPDGKMPFYLSDGTLKYIGVYNS